MACTHPRRALAVAVVIAVLGACGGGDDGSPNEDPVAPSITIQPADESVPAGQDATFSVTATGTDLLYQWQRSSNGGVDFIDVPGATESTLTLSAVGLADDAHQFRAVVSNSTASVTSDDATLTIAKMVMITTALLPGGIKDVGYNAALAATGGTGIYTWAVVSGELPSGLALDASSGAISGTPTTWGESTLTFEVADSSTPSQLDEKMLTIHVASCDGVSVSGAPSTVEGAFCPQAAGTGTTGPDRSSVVWTETYSYGGGSYYESLGVFFDAASGDVDEISFYLNDPTHTITWMCSNTSTLVPPCTGAMVDVLARKASFTNLELGENGSFVSLITLFGDLTYAPF
jgi:hypothetical protein